MNNKKFNVTIIQSADPAQTSTTSISALAKLFKIPTDKAEKILQKTSFTIKKATDKATAEKFHKAITTIGVDCRIEEVTDDEEDIALPEIEDVKTTDKGRPLIDITRPDITPLHQEQPNLSLAAGPEETTAKKDKIRPIDNVAPENFCPECGTIRASASSSCIHCGYEPIVIKQNSTKTMLIKLGVLLVVVIMGIVIALPYYQQYNKRTQVKNDLQLAFDTRNKVTDFILQTNFWPNQNIDAGLGKQISNQSLKSVVIGNNPVITIVIRASALEGKEQTLIFTPNILKGRIVWNCLNGSLHKDYRPDICQPHVVD